MSSINIDDLTNGQLIEIEDATGRTMDELFINGKPTWLLKTALTWLAKRVNNPELTFDQIKAGSYDLITEVGTDDPKEPTPENPGQ